MKLAIFLTIAAICILQIRADPTCPKVDGPDSVYFPHKDCTKFWQCSNGVPYLFDCPDNLHFNPDLNVCDWPENAGCDGSSSSSSSSSESSDSSSSSGSSESNGDDNKSGDDDTSGGDSSSSSSESGSNESGECPAVDGPDSVYIPDEDCTIFWQCSNGEKIKQNCPDGLHFNPKLNVCDWPNAAGCEGSSESDSSSSSSSSESKGDDSTSGDDDKSGDDDTSGDDSSSSSSSESGSNESGECPAVDGPDSVYIPDEDCTIFWQCSNGEKIKQNCPDGLHFNPKLNVCDWPNAAGCEGSSESDSSSSSSESNGDDSTSGDDDNKSGDDTSGDDNSSGSSSSSSSESNGDDSTSGDDDNKSGDDTSGDDNSSGSSSSSSSESGSNESGECPAVDGPDSVYIPDEDCTIFWQCSNGEKIKQNCPDGLHFNPKLNVCDWPNAAGCEGSSGSDSSSSSSSSESNGDDNTSGDDDNKSGDDNSSGSSSSSSESGSNESGECPAVDGPDSVYIPDKDCTIFWQCSNGRKIKQNCPDGLHFNPDLNVCDWPNAAGCKGGSSSSESVSQELV